MQWYLVPTEPEISGPLRDTSMYMKGTAKSITATSRYSATDGEQISFRHSKRSSGSDTSFVIEGSRIRDLINSFRVVHLGSVGPGIILSGPSHVVELSLKSAETYAPTRRTIVVGNVFAIFDATGHSLEITERPILCVSAAAFNFAFKSPDFKYFISDSSITSKRQYDLFVNNLQTGEWQQKVDKIISAMADMWYLILMTMEEHTIQYACLTAIGCGSFMGCIDEVPDWWASALVAVRPLFGGGGGRTGGLSVLRGPNKIWLPFVGSQDVKK